MTWTATCTYCGATAQGVDLDAVSVEIAEHLAAVHPDEPAAVTWETDAPLVDVAPPAALVDVAISAAAAPAPTVDELADAITSAATFDDAKAAVAALVSPTVAAPPLAEPPI